MLARAQSTMCPIAAGAILLRYAREGRSGVINHERERERERTPGISHNGNILSKITRMSKRRAKYARLTAAPALSLSRVRRLWSAAVAIYIHTCSARYRGCLHACACVQWHVCVNAHAGVREREN